MNNIHHVCLLAFQKRNPHESCKLLPTDSMTTCKPKSRLEVAQLPSHALLAVRRDTKTPKREHAAKRAPAQNTKKPTLQ